MRTIRLATIILIVLMAFSYATKPATSRYALPEYGKTVGYVRTLIDSYNALVQNSTFIKRADFNSIKANLSLYHDPGHSFHVIVLQSVPDNADYVALMFFQIRADEPNVTMDYNDTFTTLFQHAFYIASEYGLLENNVLVFGNTRISLPLVWIILSSDISGDYLTSAKNAARYIYHQDTKGLPSPPPPPPPIHTTFSVTLSLTASVSAQVSATVQSSSTEQSTSQTSYQRTLTVATTKTNLVPEYIGPTTTTTTNFIVTTNVNPLITDLNEIFVNAIAILLAGAAGTIAVYWGLRSVRKARKTGKQTWLSKMATELLRDKTVKDEEQPDADVKKNSKQQKKSQK